MASLVLGAARPVAPRRAARPAASMAHPSERPAARTSRRRATMLTARNERSPMPENSVTISLGTVADYPRAQAVIEETFAFHQQAAPDFFQESTSPPPTLATIEALLENESGAWFLADHERAVIGFVTVQIRPPAQEPYLVPERRALVQNLGMLSAWRGQGIGRTLMEAAEAWARQHGATRLVLNVWEFNVDALRFYETLGYSAFSRNMWKAL